MHHTKFFGAALSIILISLTLAACASNTNANSTNRTLSIAAEKTAVANTLNKFYAHFLNYPVVYQRKIAAAGLNFKNGSIVISTTSSSKELISKLQKADPYLTDIETKGESDAQVLQNYEGILYVASFEKNQKTSIKLDAKSVSISNNTAKVPVTALQFYKNNHKQQMTSTGSSKVENDIVLNKINGKWLIVLSNALF